jgi:hypothetical protein
MYHLNNKNIIYNCKSYIIAYSVYNLSLGIYSQSTHPLLKNKLSLKGKYPFSYFFLLMTLCILVTKTVLTHALLIKSR